MRAGRHYLCNPFRGGTRSHDDWSNGHTHEAAGEHLRFGLDLIKDKPAGSRVFEIDPDVPRDLDGNVDMEWYSLALLGMELSRS